MEIGCGRHEVRGKSWRIFGLQQGDNRLADGSKLPRRGLVFLFVRGGRLRRAGRVAEEAQQHDRAQKSGNETSKMDAREVHGSAFLPHRRTGRKNKSCHLCEGQGRSKALASGCKPGWHGPVARTVRRPAGRNG